MFGVTIRVPFLLLFGFSKGTLKEKGQKGNTQEPSLCIPKDWRNGPSQESRVPINTSSILLTGLITLEQDLTLRALPEVW